MGLKELFIKNKARIDAQVGLVVSEQGIALAYRADANQHHINCAFFEQDDVKALQDWVSEHKLQGKGVRIVLDYKQYHLYQIEPPTVPEAELNQALLYSLRDRLEYPLNEAQVDSFEMPRDAARGARAKVNVVAAHLPLLKNKLSLIQKSGLTPSVIDIPEMAFRDLLLSRKTMEKGICLVNYHEQMVTLMIFRKGNLYLSRQINIPSWSACLVAKGDAASENLVLEIQRTMDYYQSQLNQPPIAEILIPQGAAPLQSLIDYLHENLGTTVSRLENLCADKPDDSMVALRQLMLASAAMARSGFKSKRSKNDKAGSERLKGANHQQVNLYRGQLIPRPEALPVHTLIYATLVGVVLSLLLWFIQWNGLNKVKQLAQIQQKQQQKMFTQLSKLQTLIPAVDMEARANASIKKLQYQLQQRQQTSELIKQLNTTQGKGFSTIFEDLAQVNTRNLWLTRIFIKNHKLNLEGKTLEAASVPKLVIQLQKSTNSRNILFNDVSIERKNIQDKAVAFYLYSDIEAASDGI